MLKLKGLAKEKPLLKEQKLRNNSSVSSPRRFGKKNHCKAGLWREKRERERLLTNFSGPSMVVDMFRYSLLFNFYSSSVRHQNAHKEEKLRL